MTTRYIQQVPTYISYKRKRTCMVWCGVTTKVYGLEVVIAIAFALTSFSQQPVREAVSYRGLFTAGWFGVREKYYSRLEIYDRLRASEQARIATKHDNTSANHHYLKKQKQMKSVMDLNKHQTLLLLPSSSKLQKFISNF